MLCSNPRHADQSHRSAILHVRVHPLVTCGNVGSAGGHQFSGGGRVGHLAGCREGSCRSHCGKKTGEHQYLHSVTTSCTWGLESFVVFNPDHPKSFKILYMLLYDFGGFWLVECSYHVFTWGLMSQFCLSTKNVPFGYCTV